MAGTHETMPFHFFSNQVVAPPTSDDGTGNVSKGDHNFFLRIWLGQFAHLSRDKLESERLSVKSEMQAKAVTHAASRSIEDFHILNLFKVKLEAIELLIKQKMAPPVMLMDPIEMKVPLRPVSKKPPVRKIPQAVLRYEAEQKKFNEEYDNMAKGGSEEAHWHWARRQRMLGGPQYKAMLQALNDRFRNDPRQEKIAHYTQKAVEREWQLQDLLKKAKDPNQPFVTDEELLAATRAVLVELANAGRVHKEITDEMNVGVMEDSDGNPFEVSLEDFDRFSADENPDLDGAATAASSVAAEAMGFVTERDFKNTLQKYKSGAANGLTTDQIRTDVARLLGRERQALLIGGLDEDALPHGIIPIVQEVYAKALARESGRN